MAAKGGDGGGADASGGGAGAQDQGPLSLPEKMSLWASLGWSGDLKYPEIGKVGCMRDSFLYGIGSGFPAGLLTFLHTKTVIKGCRAAVASCVVVGIGTWEYCRYARKKQQEMVEKAVVAMNKPGALDGLNGNAGKSSGGTDR